jgi:predicted nucleic acid-binding Zn ribbon protein
LRIDPPASDSKSGPEKFGDILGKLFAARGWGRQQERNRLERAWAESVAEVAGADVPIHTRVLGLKRGLLEVEVDSPVRLQELAQFHKRRLLEQLRSRMGGTTISDLRFRVGVWKTKGA